MKVVFLTSVHTVWDTRIYHREAKSLVQAGYQVTIIATGITSQKTAENIDLIGLKRPKWRIGRVFNWLPFIKAALQTQADLFHFHDPDLLVVGVILKYLTKKPVIYDNHDPYVEAILQREWLPGWSRPIISRIFDLFEKGLANKLSAMIVANGYQQLRFPQSTLICNYPDLEPFTQVSRRRSSSRQLIYAGFLSEARGLFDLIEIVALLTGQRSDVTFSILGPLPNSQIEQEVEQFIEKHQLQQVITFEGRVPYNRIVTGLSKSSIGLIPFRNVPDHLIIVPTKLFEYMACALPVVASDLPPIRQYVSNINCGLLVEPENPQAFVEAIEYLLDNWDEARQMGQNGYRAVIEKYNWTNEAQNLLKLYDDLLK